MTPTLRTPSGTGSNTFLWSSRGIWECSGRITYLEDPEIKSKNFYRWNDFTNENKITRYIKYIFLFLFWLQFHSNGLTAAEERLSASTSSIVSYGGTRFHVWFRRGGQPISIEVSFLSPTFPIHLGCSLASGLHCLIHGNAFERPLRIVEKICPCLMQQKWKQSNRNLQWAKNGRECFDSELQLRYLEKPKDPSLYAFSK